MRRQKIAQGLATGLGAGFAATGFAAAAADFGLRARDFDFFSGGAGALDSWRRRIARSRSVRSSLGVNAPAWNSCIVPARTDAFEQLIERSLEDRKRIIDHIRRISIEQSVELGTMEMEETKIGRLEHKIEKLRTLGERTRLVAALRGRIEIMIDPAL